jgi:hypothetical protein
MESGSRWHPRDANQDQLFRYFRACRLAPVLPFSESGNFGTSPFFGQHFKPLRLYRALMAVSEVNSNSGKYALGTFQLSGCALTRCCRNRTPTRRMSPPGPTRTDGSASTIGSSLVPADLPWSFRCKAITRSTCNAGSLSHTSSTRTLLDYLQRDLLALFVGPGELLASLTTLCTVRADLWGLLPP